MHAQESDKGRVPVMDEEEWQTMISDDERSRAVAELRKASTWAYRHVDALDVIACSACGETFCADGDVVNHPIDWAFCPNCGAEVVE